MEKSETVNKNYKSKMWTIGITLSSSDRLCLINIIKNHSRTKEFKPWVLVGFTHMFLYIYAFGFRYGSDSQIILADWNSPDQLIMPLPLLLTNFVGVVSKFNESLLMCSSWTHEKPHVLYRNYRNYRKWQPICYM